MPLDYRPYALAQIAECATPDTESSPGANFLTLVQDGVNDQIDSVRDGSIDADTLVSEIADGAPNVYTYKRWQEFVDVAAWQEDPTELGSEASDMTACAGVCLYLIAQRLAYALIAEALPDEDDDEDDTDEDDDDTEDD